LCQGIFFASLEFPYTAKALLGTVET